MVGCLNFLTIVSNEFANFQPNDFNMVKFVDVPSKVTLHTLNP